MNPWLNIPLEDYERHMAHPTVAQGEYLAGTLQRLAEEYVPDSLAVIGCAGGNGFERLPGTIGRLVAVDINPAYLARAKSRYASRFQQLEFVGGDITSASCDFEPVDLIFAGLVFEYIDTKKGLASLRRLIRPGGIIAVVLQLPGDSVATVSRTPYTSVQNLNANLRLVPPESLIAAALEAGLELRSSLRQDLSTGKSFQEILFQPAWTTPP